MRRKAKPVAPSLPKIEIGTAYKVLGYHSGDFVGTCKSTTRRSATFVVDAPLNSTLSLGFEIEVPLALARFGIAG